MIVDKDKLRKQLEEQFPVEVVDSVLIALQSDGLPLSVPVSKLDIEIGKNVSIKFLNTFGNEPDSNDVLGSCYWDAKIEGLDNRQIKSITIPTLTYEDCDVMTIDVTIYPFKIKNILEKEKIWN